MHSFRSELTSSASLFAFLSCDRNSVSTVSSCLRSDLSFDASSSACRARLSAISASLLNLSASERQVALSETSLGYAGSNIQVGA